MLKISLLFGREIASTDNQQLTTNNLIKMSKPRQTKKYSSAGKLAKSLNFAGDWNKQDEVYGFLQQNNYFWNSKTKEWKSAGQAKPPTNLVELRALVGGESESILMGQLLKYIFERCWLEFIKISPPYSYRPPNQNDYRVYLTFKKTPEFDEFCEFCRSSLENQ